MKKIVSIHIVMLLQMFTATFLFSQFIGSLDLVQGGINDGEKLIKAYLTPFEKSLNAIGRVGYIDFSNGEKKLSFSVRLNIIGALTPRIDRTYDANKLGLENIRPSDINKTIAQTFSGDANTIELESTETYRIPSLSFPFYTDNPIYKFNSPAGSNNSLLMLPILSAGMSMNGSFVNFRILPKIKIPNIDGSIFLYGMNVQLNTKQFIKSMEKLPVDLNIIVGYQSSILSVNPNIVPDETKIGLSLDDNGPYDNQELNSKSYSFPIEVVVSKTYQNLNVFGGLGFVFASSKFEMAGNYPIYVSDPADLFGLLVEDIKDPINYAQNHNTFFFDAGLMYHIKLFKILAGYSYSKYSTLNFGVGVEF